MKKYIFGILAIIACLITISVQKAKIDGLKEDRNKYRDNTEALMQSVDTYRTKDSLSVAKVGVLELKISEMEKYRAEDMKLIESLRIKNKDLEAVTKAQAQTITELEAEVRDSIIYLPGDSTGTAVKHIRYADRWVELDGYLIGDTFKGEIISYDSLTIVETVEYRKFLFWRTKKVKSREFQVVSSNPRTNILGIEAILIER